MLWTRHSLILARSIRGSSSSSRRSVIRIHLIPKPSCPLSSSVAYLSFKLWWSRSRHLSLDRFAWADKTLGTLLNLPETTPQALHDKKLPYPNSVCVYPLAWIAVNKSILIVSYSAPMSGCSHLQPRAMTHPATVEYLQAAANSATSDVGYLGLILGILASGIMQTNPAKHRPPVAQTDNFNAPRNKLKQEPRRQLPC